MCLGRGPPGFCIPDKKEQVKPKGFPIKEPEGGRRILEQWEETGSLTLESSLDPHMIWKA